MHQNKHPKQLQNNERKEKTKPVSYTHLDVYKRQGQIWEALMFAAAKKVDNVIATIDYNGRQIDGDTDDVLSLSLIHI